MKSMRILLQILLKMSPVVPYGIYVKEFHGISFHVIEICHMNLVNGASKGN